MFDLSGKTALVTGATRGIGKGIALHLAKCGAEVYFTGRTEVPYEGAVQLGGSLGETEAAIAAAGGVGHAIKCDHTDDAQTKAAVERVLAQRGKIDILVNCAWGGYEYFNDGTEFWTEQGFWTAPLSRFDKMFDAGVRAHYVTSVCAIPSMIAAGGGLIVNLSVWAAERDDMGVPYGMAKAATNQMTRTMAHDLRDKNISVITIYPGLVRTESVEKADGFFDLSNSESTEFIGMAVAALAADPEVLRKSGTIQVAAQVALDYGYTDLDGTQPTPLTQDSF